MPGRTVPSPVHGLSFHPSPRPILLHSRIRVTRYLLVPLFLQLAAPARHPNGTLPEERENLGYKERCTFRFIFLEPAGAGNCVLTARIQRCMSSICTIEYGSGNIGRRCGRTAVAECGHCGASVCSSCAKECCAQALCGYCYDFHVIHSCIMSAPPTEFLSVPVAFRPAPHPYAV